MTDSSTEKPSAADAAEQPKTATNTDSQESNGDPGKKVIGEFQLIRKLGSGGMGQVWLAEQTSLHRQVALKILAEDKLADPKLVARFRTEARAAAKLSHPNIVQVYLIGEANGYHFIAQEYVPGMNLYQYLGKKESPSLNLILKIMKQVAQALQLAGSQGIVHRDIKPENIMITKQGNVKVADFGLARLTQGARDVNLTQEGVTMGTPTYMSPEQVEGRPVDPRSDIYSFGVMCYRLLAGKPPFEGETPLALAIKHVREQPPALRKQCPDLPNSIAPALCDMVHKMMAKKPDDRYASADGILKDLKRITTALQDGSKAKLGPEERNSDVNVASPIRAFEWVYSIRRFALAAISLCLLGAAVGWISRPANPLASKAPAPTAEIPRMENAREQYTQASLLVGTPREEMAWLAVIDYVDQLWPDNYAVKQQAEEQLALYYLKKNDYSKAASYFKKFISYGTSNKQLLATGYAGEAIIASLKQDFKQSNLIILNQKSLFMDQLAGEIRGYLKQTAERNLANLESARDPMRPTLEQLIEDLEFEEVEEET